MYSSSNDKFLFCSYINYGCDSYRLDAERRGVVSIKPVTRAGSGVWWTVLVLFCAAARLRVATAAMSAVAVADRRRNKISEAMSRLSQSAISHKTHEQSELASERRPRLATRPGPSPVTSGGTHRFSAARLPVKTSELWSWPASN